jgi:quinol monooxygenase YgiN
MISLVVRFTLLPDHLDAFDALVSDVIEQIDIHEPGTLVYLSHQRTDNLNERVFYECYQSEEAIQAHENQEYVKRFLGDLREHLAQAPEIWRMSTIEGLIRGEAPAR